MLETSAFFLAFILSILTTLFVKHVALKYKIVDKPDRLRKIHTKIIPLLGGAAIFASFFAGILAFSGYILARGLFFGQLLSFFIGALILTTGGILDDKYELKPWRHILFPTLSAVILMLGGISILKITNPLSQSVGEAGGLIYFGAVISYLLTFIWVMGMTYTTKLLDGIDGLVSGLGVISGLIIFLFTMTTKYYQPDVGLMALIFAAACLGFLIFNFYPAKIFLGDGGSLLIGYVIAVLAIISGAKIAVALLIMGIPIMDVVWTIFRRLIAGKNPFKYADKKHLHHRFLDMGLSQRQTAILYYFFALFFGSLALFLQSRGKIIAIGILAIIMTFIALLSIFVPKKNVL